MLLFVGHLRYVVHMHFDRNESGNHELTRQHLQEDGLQWIIEKSYDTKDMTQLDPGRITRRLLYVNDISLHSTSYTVQNVILDLYGCEQSENLVSNLRDECASALKEAGGLWTRDAVQQLKLVDATVRESMRLTPFASIGLPRTASFNL